MKHTNMIAIEKLRKQKIKVMSDYQKYKNHNPEYKDKRIHSQIGSYTIKINKLMKVIKLEEEANFSLAKEKITALRIFALGNTTLHNKIVEIEKLLEPMSDA